jgi:malate dehydrogenase (oxaloacetate-decarboxylating)
MPKLSPYFETRRDERGVHRMIVQLSGVPLLRLAATNKGTAFTEEERAALGLDGLLPPHVSTIEEQVVRVYAAYLREPTPIARYVFLRQVQERNETLFYALLEQHLGEMMPIIYTPTVGDAVKQFSAIYQIARGLSFTPKTITRAADVMKGCLYDDVRMIVATDSSAILGIGDQGWGGLAIPIGKLALYTAGGGLSPWRSLPVALDVGTDRDDLREEAQYLGFRGKRLRGAEYLDFIDRFVAAVKERYPHTVLQWEDLSKDAAFTVLARYRKELPSFNDDIQGTGAVALAGVVSACTITKQPLKDRQVIVYGAGAGGAGVAWEIVRGMIAEGLTEEQALSQVWVLDSKGLLLEGRAMEDYKLPFVRTKASIAAWGTPGTPTLLDVIQHAKPSILLGLSGQPGTFTEEVIRAMGANAERPIIFPLSNPTSSCEAQPADIIAWTDGRALVSTGSPFESVEHAGVRHEIGQGNNSFIFPGLGFGAILAEVSEITDAMVTAASRGLSDYTAEKHLANGHVYPPVEELREVAVRVAARVILQARKDGVARTTKPIPKDVESYVRSKMWRAEYLPFLPA